MTFYALVCTDRDIAGGQSVRLFATEQQAVDYGWRQLKQHYPKGAAWDYPQTKEGMTEFANDNMLAMDWFFVEEVTVDGAIFTLAASRNSQ